MSCLVIVFEGVLLIVCDVIDVDLVDVVFS